MWAVWIIPIFQYPIWYLCYWIMFCPSSWSRTLTNDWEPETQDQTISGATPSLLLSTGRSWEPERAWRQDRSPLGKVCQIYFVTSSKTERPEVFCMCNILQLIEFFFCFKISLLVKLLELAISLAGMIHKIEIWFGWPSCLSRDHKNP